MSDNRSFLNIEYFSSGNVWVPTAEKPAPHTAQDGTSQEVDESVWRAYVDYLNARVRDTPHTKNLYRLTRVHVKTLRTVVHV